MKVAQLIELLQEFPDHRDVMVDGAWVEEVVEVDCSDIDGDNAPVVMVR